MTFPKEIFLIDDSDLFYNSLDDLIDDNSLEEGDEVMIYELKATKRVTFGKPKLV